MGVFFYLEYKKNKAKFLQRRKICLTNYHLIGDPFSMIDQTNKIETFKFVGIIKYQLWIEAIDLKSEDAQE